ncbi:MAG: IS91 family transposase [Oribacterium sp.]|uniref:IS91 family transposase n=1 Tax=Butyrivibrio sp. TaxID=28121 RepID=UPI001B2340D8|nr:IS91 family transposase [Butyrivibrio sp.]MBO5599221.1 IS91 family transposase [Oribacterium sp.]MBO6239512.1 IS91 family transposase [Butyrivibrio sp.]
MTSTDPYPIRGIFQKFFPAYLEEHPDLPMYKYKTAQCIMKCKTGELGYNASVCDECGNVVIHAVSCNNRSCPCCQAPLEKKWEASRNTELIDGTAYFHVVFTIPHELNRLYMLNMKEMTNLFFRTVHETLIELCADRKFMGAKPGIVSVLHTWGQKLNFHPHLHICVSGGGITPDGKFVETGHKGFFIPQQVLSASFKGRFMRELKLLYETGQMKLPHESHLGEPDRWKVFVDSLYAKRWMPFVKETFNGKGNAIRYLARYSYRTAIANSRIISISEKDVTFSYKDYADGNRQKTMTVSGMEFIELFLQHILPPRLNRMRMAGYLCNCKKSYNLWLIHRLRHSAYNGNPYKNMKMRELMISLFDRDICKCPACSSMMRILPRGMPKSTLPSPSYRISNLVMS